MGLLLARLREEKKVRQADLAERLGVAQSSLSRFENGQALPDPFVLGTFAEALQLSSSAELLALVDEGMVRVEKAMRQVITLPKKGWWPAAIKQAGEGGAKALVIFAVSTILAERRPQVVRA